MEWKRDEEVVRAYMRNFIRRGKNKRMGKGSKRGEEKRKKRRERKEKKQENSCLTLLRNNEKKRQGMG